jgi:hypothetical protein
MKGGLDVRLARFLLKGGEEGPAIVPGKAADSHLLKLVKAGEMPKGKAKLKASEIATIEQWIAQGAKTLRPEPEKLGPEHAFTDEERAWWAFQPIQKPTPKTEAVKSVAGANPIDAFIAAKLKESGLNFSESADPRTLLRRASFDLTGLPPTPEEVDVFTSAADQTSAYEAVIERLLSKPAYGERWGRHWLDIAGYADSDGYTEKDLERPWAWKYRDYVIAALNKDKPFDQFVREQLAGDEMVPQPHKNLTPDAIEKITATGFLRMAPDGTGAMNDKAAQNATIADIIKIVSTAFYGMTIGCAQCHDHRYDPITQADYYGLTAFFNSIDEDGKAGKGAKPYLTYESKHVDRAIQEAQQLVDSRQGPEAAARAAAEAPFEEWLAARKQEVQQGYNAWTPLLGALESSEGTLLTQSDDAASPVSAADTMSVSRRLTSCLLKWTALVSMKESSSLQQQTVLIFWTLHFFVQAVSTVRLRSVVRTLKAGKRCFRFTRRTSRLTTQSI